jgi:hypothetical protein
VATADLRGRRAGWPRRLPARAPSDPYVPILEHTVPQPTDSPPRRVPVAICPSPVDMRMNLDVAACFPRSSFPADVLLPSTGSSGASSPGGWDVRPTFQRKVACSFRLTPAPGRNPSPLAAYLRALTKHPVYPVRPPPQATVGDSAVAQPVTTPIPGRVRAPELIGDMAPHHMLCPTSLRGLIPQSRDAVPVNFIGWFGRLIATSE